MQSFDLLLEAPRAVVARSAVWEGSIEAVVCIPTFRRPEHLRKTLESLCAQRTRRCFAVAIVENDVAECEGAAVATHFLREEQMQGLCLVEPRQGNCYAINAAFEA